MIVSVKEKKKLTLDNISNEDIEIFRDAIIGFTIINGWVNPITIDYQGNSNDIADESECNIIAAPLNSYEVWASLILEHFEGDNSCSCIKLGYEIGNKSYHPNWKNEAFRKKEEFLENKK